MREGCPPLAEALAAYFDDLLIGGKSPATIRTYRSLLKLADWPTEPVCRAIIRERVLARSMKTAECVHVALKGFCAFAVMRGWLVANPMDGIPAPKPKAAPHRYMTKAQVQAVYAACDSDQSRLIVRLLLLGLRANELLALRWEHVSDTVRVVYGKGGKHRLLPLDDVTQAMLAATPRVSEYVVPCRYEALAQRIRRLGARAGVPWLRCHDFRRTMASWWALETQDIATLQQLGGWASLTMPQHYARSAMQMMAVEKARNVGLTARLLGEE